MIKRVDNKAFTLVEVMLILVIIGIILVLAIPRILDAVEENRSESGKSVEKLLTRNLELYNKDHEDDLWIKNSKSNCTTIPFSELLTVNEDIKLGECLLQSTDSLIIEKTEQNKYKFYAYVACGKELPSIGTGDNDKYILKDGELGSNKNIYYKSKVTFTCDPNFNLKAALNGGEYEGDGWNSSDTGYITKEYTSGVLYGDLPIPTKSDGATFLGWNTSSDGSGIFITKDDKVTREIDTIYAIWSTKPDSSKFVFTGQTIKLTYKDVNQSRNITAFRGGVTPYKYEKTGGDTDRINVDGNKIVVMGETPAGTYHINVKATDDEDSVAPEDGNGTITIIIENPKISLKCPTLDNYNGVYDGKSHGIIVGNNAFLGNDGKIEYRVDGGSWTTTAPVLTNVGSKAVSVRVHSDNSYYISTDCGAPKNINITARPLKVKADDKTRTNRASNPEFTYSYSGNVSGEKPKFTGSLTTDATADSPAGTYDITRGDLALDDGTGGFLKSNYTLSYEKGSLIITEDDREPAIINCSDKIYDGTEQTACTCTGGTIGGDYKAVNANTDDNPRYTATCTADATHSAASNKTWVMQPKSVTIEATNQSKTFDNNPLVADSSCELVDSTLVDGHTISSCTSTGSRTNSGISDKVLESVVITDSNGIDVSSNYAIDKQNGKLEVLCDTKVSGTIAVGNTVTYAGLNWTVKSKSADGKNLNLVFNGKVDSTGTYNGTSGGTYNNAKNAVSTWIDKNAIMADAVRSDVGCIVNHNSDGDYGKSSSYSPSFEYWRKSGSVYVPRLVKQYTLYSKTYHLGYGGTTTGAFTISSSIANSHKEEVVKYNISDTASVSNTKSTITYSKSVLSTDYTSTTYSLNGYTYLHPDDSISGRAPSSTRLPMIGNSYQRSGSAVSNMNTFKVFDSEKQFTGQYKHTAIICGGSNHGKTYVFNAKDATHYTTQLQGSSKSEKTYSKNWDFYFAGRTKSTTDSSDNLRTFDFKSGHKFDDGSWDCRCGTAPKYSTSDTSYQIYYRPYITVNNYKTS